MANSTKPDPLLMKSHRISDRTAGGICVFIAIGAYVILNVWIGWRGETERQQRHEAWAVRKVAQMSSIEEGEPGYVRLFVSPAAGEVVWDGYPIKCSVTNSPYVWKVPPPNGAAIPLTAEGDDDLIFFACSKQTNSKGFRSFVFPAPVYQRILRDQDVDWERQRVK
jgi:hypothetical protein